MRDSYDFADGIRGKYASRFKQGTNVVVLDPDVARVFGDQKSVNDTLRAVVRILDVQVRRTRSSPKKRRRRR